MSRKSIFLLGLIFVTIAVAATALSYRDQTEKNENEPIETKESATSAKSEDAKMRPVNVKVAKVGLSQFTEVVTANGTTAAEKDVTFSAEVPGRIEYMGAKLGQRIARGRVLARIDFRSLKAQKDNAESNYTLAQTTHGRLSELGEELVSKQKLDEVRFSVTGAKAQFEVASASLAKSTIKSGITGIVSAKYVEKGEYVGPGTPMYRIINYKTIIINAQLAETQVSRIQVGSPVEVYVDALDNTFEGTVDTILPTADSVSKTFTVRIKVTNPELKILVGMSASLKIKSEVQKDVVVVLQDVVVENKDSRNVFVANDGVAQRREVVLGSVLGDKVVIVQGLAPGEDVIVLGHRGLKDRQPIIIVQ